MDASVQVFILFVTTIKPYKFQLRLRVEALAIADYRSPRNATRSRNGNRPLLTAELYMGPNFLNQPDPAQYPSDLTQPDP